MDISSLRDAYNRLMAGGRPPVEMAGPQGSLMRNTADMAQLQQAITKLVAEGRDQEAMILAEKLKQLQNPQPLQP